MICKTIHLKEHYPVLKNDVTLLSYCPENFANLNIGRKRKTILLIPGGAYCFVAPNEAEPVALRLLGQDINVFLLRYSVKDYDPPYPFIEGFAAISYIREHAEEYHVDEDHIGVLGFSAGGHFAASLGAFCEKKEYADYLSVPLTNIKVNGVLLGYPVITMGEFTHKETSEQLLMRHPEKKEEYSIEKQITPAYPVTFLWTTNDDTTVDPLNSLLLAMALKKAGVRFEFHYYPVGGHGASLADPISNPIHTDPAYLQLIHYFDHWIYLAIKFIQEIM